jgi:hypothetical protein
MHRRTFLTRTGAGVAATSLLAGCTGAGSSEPTYSYEAIVGVWAGETYHEDVLIHDVLRVEVTTGTAGAGEEIGTVRFIDEQDDEAVCDGPLLAHHSDPPTFWVGVGGDRQPCSAIARCRLRHDPERDRIFWFTRTEQDKSYEPTTILSLERG